MGWKDKIKQGLEYPGRFLENGGHAQQTIPSQHRLLNAGVMFIGWWGLDKVRKAVFGMEQKSEGEYVEVKREDIPAPLRFLYKTIDWNPHSESPEDQWKKLTYQLFPAVGAGVGAVIGSEMAFQFNNRAHAYAKNSKASTLNIMDADASAQYSFAMPLRALSAFFGTFSAASGLTFLYGMFLNNAFLAANGARMFTGSLRKGNAGPAKALEAQLGTLSEYVKAAAKSGGEVSDAWAGQFVERVLEPLFGHELQTPAAQEKARAALQHIVEESYHKFLQNGKPAAEIAKAVSEDLTKQLSKDRIGEVLKKKFGLDPANAMLGNANKAHRTLIKPLQDAFGIEPSVSGFEAKMRHRAAATPSPTPAV